LQGESVLEAIIFKKGKTMNKQTMSRRIFLGGVVAAGAASIMPRRGSCAAGARPDSNFGGIQIGAITYSYRDMPQGAEEVLGYVIESGLSSVELMSPTAESYAGMPKTNPKDKESAKKLLEWRLSVPMEKYQALRRMYEDAGVKIHIVKFGDIGNAGMPDEQIEYYFKVARALGARGITRELSEDAAKRLGPIADRHQIMIGFHNHTQIKPTTYDGTMLSYGKHLAINLDIGHYVAGTNESPMPMIEKYRDRILSLHLKDRKKNNGPNMPFGEGDTPITEILQYMKKNKLTFNADIELEYKVPADSTSVKEIAKCVQFCKKALC